MEQRSKKQTVEGEKGPPYQKESVLMDLRVKQEDVTQSRKTCPVARVDFLDLNGKVMDSEEYHSEKDFLKALQEESYYGVPLIAVLYRDEKGKTISKRFLEDLDTLPKGLTEEDFSGVRIRNSPFTKENER